MRNKLFSEGSELRPLDHVRKYYPNAVDVPVCAWDVSHVYYEDESYSNKVATLYYTKIPDSGIIGVKLNLEYSKEAPCLSEQNS